MTFNICLAAGALLLSSGAALAQGFNGVTFRIGNWQETGGSDAQTSLGASSYFTLGQNFGLIMGGSLNRYDGNIQTTAVEAHGTYGWSDRLTTGLYAGRENGGGRVYTYFGFEAAMTSGAFGVEASYGWNKSGAFYDANHYTLDVSYAVLPDFGLALVGGLHGANDGDDQSYNYAGLSWGVTDSLALSATYAKTTSFAGEDNVAGIGLTWNFGREAPFQPRAFGSVLPTQ